MAILTTPSTAGFIQVGNDKWKPDGWGLDTLTVDMQGPKSKLAAYIAGLTMWSAASADANMFLSDWLPDNDPVKPTVDLIYLGKKGGTLPPVRTEHGMSLQTASTTNGQMQLEILYRSPFTKMSWIGDDDTMAHSGFSNPRSTSIITRRINGHTPIVFRYADAVRNGVAYAAASDALRTRIDDFLTANAGIISDAVDAIIDYFNQVFDEEEQVTNFVATEVVPGEYYECSSTTSLVLVPV